MQNAARQHMLIDERVGSAELEVLAEALAPPCQIGEYVLEGLIHKTSTALIFVCRGGVFGQSDGVLKLTGAQFAPLLERELGLLNRCAEAEIRGVVRPVESTLQRIELSEHGQVAAIALPFLSGGDLVQWIATQHGLRSGLALEIAELIASVLRGMLDLPRPLIHGDVKPQNVLLPRPGAPLSELTIIDLDASEEVDDLATVTREGAQRLVDDVNGFGELLYVLATGREPPVDGEPGLDTDNPAFSGLVLKCMSSEVDGSGYACLADNGLWRDLEKALAFERARKPLNPVQRFLLSRRSIGALGVVLFAALLAAIASKFLLS
jgi:serine/threonine protein kinase